MILAHQFHQCRPAHLSIVHRHVDVCLFQHLLAQHTHLNEFLAATILNGYTCCENIVGSLLAHHHAWLCTYAAQYVLHICLQLIEAAILICMNPAVLNALSCEPQGQMIIFLVCRHRVVRILALWVEMINIAKLKESEVCVLTLDVIFKALQSAKEQ